MANTLNRSNSVPSIPFELGEFMKNDSYSLLIKGRSGSGKTTLSLSILRSLGEKNNFFYISTRSSPKQLIENYPWLRKIIKEPNKDIDSQELGQNLSSFEDARLDEPESLFERVTNQLMDVKNPVIIIDSWDSVASLMDREARLNNERVLQTWRERAKAKLIFTSEESVESNLEYIVDGVVELSYQFMDAVRIRSLLLKKLRGIQINKSIYFFTLKDRILRCFDGYDPREFKINDSIEKILKGNNSKQILQTGYRDLDNYIGSLPQGGLITIEKDHSLTDDVVLLFLNDVLHNFSKMHYCLLLDSSIKDELILTYRSNIQNYAKLFTFDRLSSTENSFQNEVKGRDDFYKYVANEVTGFEGKGKVVTLMRSISLENFIPSYYDIVDYCKSIKRNFELSILILNSNNNNLEKYYQVSDIHLKFVLISGTLFLKCVTPHSALFGIRVVNSIPQIELNHVL